MDFWDLTKLLVRRWYLSLPLMLSTLAGTAVLVVNIEPDHILTTHVVLVPPPGATEETAALQATNPWLSLGSALAESAKLSIEGEDVIDGLDEKGLSDTYTVTVNPFSPIIDLEIVGNSSEQATETADRLISLLDRNVQQLQETQGAQPGTYTVVRQLPGIKLEESDSKVKRAAVAVGAAGLLLASGLTVMIDALLRRRQRRRSGKTTTTPRRYIGRQAVPAETPRRVPAASPPTALTKSVPVQPTPTGSGSTANGSASAEPPTVASTVPDAMFPTDASIGGDPAGSEQAALAGPNGGAPEATDRTVAVYRSGNDAATDDATVILVPPAPVAGAPISGKRPLSKRRGPRRR